MLKLHFKDGRQAPIWLVDERLTLGSDRRNNLFIEGDDIGAFHAEIRQVSGLYYISDCNSEAGVFVNDERITSRYQLRAADSLRLGALELFLTDPTKNKAAVPEPPRWYLQVVQGENEGKKYHVTGAMTFGRSVQCELCFSDGELSRRHCEFRLKDGMLEVRDLASANGLTVNGEKQATALLQPGDVVRMGSVSLLVIGPKVEMRQSEGEDEDATLFMRAVDMPKPVASPVRPASTVNPLRATVEAAQPVEAPAASGPALGKWVLVVLVVVGLGGLGLLVLGQV